MANHRWRGQTPAVAQVWTAEIDSVDATPANNTFTVTIGGVAVSVVGDTDVNTTAANLRTALNASTHPYFSCITWSVVGPGGPEIIGTADNAGVPFTATLTETGAGTGAVTDFVVTTANDGPNILKASNFDSGTLPVNGDTIVFENSTVDVLWSLDALTAVTTLTIKVEKSFTGKIGLNKRVFQVSATSTSSAAPEYREDEFTCDGWTLLNLPEHFGTGAPSGSGRLLFNGKTSQCTTIIEDTFSGSTELGEPVRIRGTHTSNALYVNGGTVGFATNDPFDAGALATLFVAEQGKCIVAPGVTTLTAVSLDRSATAYIQCAATTITVNDGNLITNGSGAITTLNSKGGKSVLKSSGTITTLNLDGGFVDMTEDERAKTITTLASTAAKGVSGTIVYDPAIVTVTNKLAPARRVSIIATGV